MMEAHMNRVSKTEKKVEKHSTMKKRKINIPLSEMFLKNTQVLNIH